MDPALQAMEGIVPQKAQVLPRYTWRARKRPTDRSRPPWGRATTKTMMEKATTTSMTATKTTAMATTTNTVKHAGDRDAFITLMKRLRAPRTFNESWFSRTN